MKVLNNEHNYCPSCNAHFMQLCICTWEQIKEAERTIKELKNIKPVKVNLSEFFDKKNTKYNTTEQIE